MQNEWREEVLVDCLDALIDYRGKTPKKSNAGILTLSAKSVKMGKINYDQAYYISKETYKKFMVRGFPEKGDILLTSEAPLGCVAKLDRSDVGLAQRLLTLRGKKNLLDNDYLMYYLMSNKGQHELISRATGTTVQGIKRTEFAKVIITLPPLPEQKAIAHILGSLDDKIELNRKMNETLEAMAQALFKSWFVDFDPVIDNALAAENEIPEELQERAEIRAALGNEHTSLPTEIRKLFPSEFIYTDEMGWIPKGWEIKALNDLISIKHGYAFKGEYFSPIPTNDILLTPGNFCIGGGFKADKFKYYSGEIPDDYVLEEWDLIVTMTDLSKEADTLGFPAFVPNGKGYRYLHNQRLGRVITGDASVGKMYLYQCLCSSGYRDEILASASGSTVKHTSPSKILAHTIAISNASLEGFFDDKCKKYFEKIHVNNEVTRELSKLRDTLLPKLLSGEFRIEDAEKLVEDAL
jgi:type I restriction enzyme S subunit